ncbi:MAG: TspO/MBR family protein [Bacilli bacterium]
MNRINFKSLAFHLLVPLMLFFIIMMLMPDFRDYYDGLSKPAPPLPRIVLIAIWSFMYLLTGLAAYFAEQSVTGSEPAKSGVFKYYFWQLLLNLFWFPVTFGLRWLLAGLLWTLALLVLAYATYRRLSGVNKTSGYLFIPYLLWLLFLAYYTFGLWAINSGGL